VYHKPEKKDHYTAIIEFNIIVCIYETKMIVKGKRGDRSYSTIIRTASKEKKIRVFQIIESAYMITLRIILALISERLVKSWQ
jgi:hypothetical protein